MPDWMKICFVIRPFNTHLFPKSVNEWAYTMMVVEEETELAKQLINALSLRR